MNGKFVSPATVALTVVAIVCYYWVFSSARYYKGDVTAHIHVGRVLVERSSSPFKPAVKIQDGAGFDGQYFLFLACDPLLRRPDTSARLDSPMLRARRIGYPMLTSILGRGHVLAMPWMMFFLCAAALGLTAGLVASTALQTGHKPAWGILVPFGLPVIMSYSCVTCECVAMAFVAGSALLFRRNTTGSMLGAAACASYAGLVRETTLLWPAAVAVSLLIERRWRWAVLFAAAAIPLLAWMTYLRFGLRLDASYERYDDLKNLGLPFVGILQHLTDLLTGAVTSKHGQVAAETCMSVGLLSAPFCAIALIARALTAERLTMLLAAILAISLSTDNYQNLIDYPRQAFVLYPLLLLILFDGRRSARLAAVPMVLFLIPGIWQFCKVF